MIVIIIVIIIIIINSKIKINFGYKFNEFFVTSHHKRHRTYKSNCIFADFNFPEV